MFVLNSCKKWHCSLFINNLLRLNIGKRSGSEIKRAKIELKAQANLLVPTDYFLHCIDNPTVTNVVVTSDDGWCYMKAH